MIRITIVLAALSAAALDAGAAPSVEVDQATVDALATTYTFGAVEAPLTGCIVTLEATPSDLRSVTVNASCRDRFAFLRAVSRWEPTGGGSIRLLGGEPLRELSNFSPVQDATGVYLRGGFEGERSAYELRPPQ
jgi:hypothetical protein